MWIYVFVGKHRRIAMVRRGELVFPCRFFHLPVCAQGGWVVFRASFCFFGWGSCLCRARKTKTHQERGRERDAVPCVVPICPLSFIRFVLAR